MHEGIAAGVELLPLHSATHAVKDGRHTLWHLQRDCQQLSEKYISNDMHFDDTYAVYNMHLRCTCNGPLAFLPKLQVMLSSGSQPAATLCRAHQVQPDSGDGAHIHSHCTLCVRHQPSGRMLNICQKTRKQVKRLIVPRPQ